MKFSIWRQTIFILVKYRRSGSYSGQEFSLLLIVMKSLGIFRKQTFYSKSPLQFFHFDLFKNDSHFFLVFPCSVLVVMCQGEAKNRTEIQVILLQVLPPYRNPLKYPSCNDKYKPQLHMLLTSWSLLIRIKLHCGTTEALYELKCFW